MRKNPGAGSASYSIICVDRDLAAAMEDYRYTARVPSGAEALRRLVAAGLDEVERDRGPHGR